MAGSFNYPLLSLPRSAGGAIAPRRILRDGATDGAVLQASATTQRLIAVAGAVALLTNQVDAVHYQGIVPVEYGDDVAAGDPLTSDANGKAIPATGGQRTIGYATEAGDNGTIGSVLIAPGYVEPTPGVVQTATLAIGFADLTDADGAQSFNFAAALPANAFVLGYDIRVTQAFTDGAAGVFTLDVGIAGDLDQLVDGAALGAIANIANAPGVRPTGKYGAATFIATVLGTVNVTNATAGAAAIEIAYVVPTP